MGRPINVQGNRKTPGKLGSDRRICASTAPRFLRSGPRFADQHREARPSDSASLKTALAGERIRLAATNGQGLRVLTGTVTSPTLAGQLDVLREHYPQARWIQWEPINRDAVRAAARIGIRQARRSHRAARSGRCASCD